MSDCKERRIQLVLKVEVEVCEHDRHHAAILTNTDPDNYEERVHRFEGGVSEAFDMLLNNLLAAKLRMIAEDSAAFNGKAGNA